LKRISTRALGVVSFAAFAAACSLMHLGDVETPPCKSHRDCASAIRAAGEDPELCVSYLCNAATGFCEPAGGEHCDAEDNDCDGFIDETLSSEPHQFENASELTRETFAYAASSNGKTYVAHGDREMGWVIPAEDDRNVSAHDLHFYFESENGRQPECPDQDGVSTCNFAQLAFAAFASGVDAAPGAFDDRLVMAGINTAGCGKGQLRLGLSSIGDPFSMFLGSVGEESPLVLGVGCEQGASFPAVAAWEATDTAQALAVWLELPINAAETVPRPIPVRALGLFVPDSIRGSLDAANEGEPTPLGESSCRSAPAVLADGRLDGQQRFAVAFPGYEQGTPGIVLRTVGFLASRDGRLEGVSMHIPETEPGPVALAPGPLQADGSPSVGIAWRTGCGMGTSVGFTTVSFPASGAPSASAPVHLSTGPIVRGPALAYAEHGFAANDPKSGWFVLWEENPAGTPRLQLARVATRELAHLEIRTLAVRIPPTWFPRVNVDAELGWGGLADSQDGPEPLPEPVVGSSVGCAESRVETL
jgi:hypothetical protein